MNKPSYVKVDGKEYKINTDFRVVIECERVVRDKSIGEYERYLAFIYLLFGKPGLDCKNPNKLSELAGQYINVNGDKDYFRNDSRTNNSNFNIDILKCEGIIRSSFKYDYGYDPYELKYLHWYDFYNDLENLSTSEFGNCCILNRIIGILNRDASQIKNSKDRAELIEMQKILKKKYCVLDEKEKELSEKEKKNVATLYKELGLWKGGDNG